MDKKINRRTITLPANLHLREAGEEGDSRILEGYALKFGVRSVLMGYWYPQYEILEPGCVTDEMLREQRIYFTMFHDRETILGRWDKGEGTLKVKVDETGLWVECEMPNTPDGDTALELVRRGDLSEMSFIYWTDEEDSENCVSIEKTDEVTDWGATISLRHVKKILGILDVTIAANPAYEDTEIQAREKQVKDYYDSIKEEVSEVLEETTQKRDDRAARMRLARKLRDIASA